MMTLYFGTFENILHYLTSYDQHPNQIPATNSKSVHCFFWHRGVFATHDYFVLYLGHIESYLTG